MKIQQVDDTPIKNIEEDWGNPDGTGKKAKTLGQVQKFIKAKINEIENKTVRIEKSNEEFESKIINQIENYKPVEIHGDVTNAADEEDLTSKDGLLKIKNRNNLNGKGFVILRQSKTRSGSKTILTQEHFRQENSIYEIRYSFDLNGEELTIPSNCTLKFAGGKLSNGTIIGANTTFSASEEWIFEDITFKGTWTNKFVSPIHFGAKSNESYIKDNGYNAYKTDYDSTSAFCQAFNSGFSVSIPSGAYYIGETIDMTKPITVECTGSSYGGVDNQFKKNKSSENTVIFSDKSGVVFNIKAVISWRNGIIDLRQSTEDEVIAFQFDASFGNWGTEINTTIFGSSSYNLVGYKFNCDDDSITASGYITYMTIKGFVYHAKYGFYTPLSSPKKSQRLRWITGTSLLFDSRGCQYVHKLHSGQGYNIGGRHQAEHILSEEERFDITPTYIQGASDLCFLQTLEYADYSDVEYKDKYTSHYWIKCDILDNSSQYDYSFIYPNIFSSEKLLEIYNKNVTNIIPQSFVFMRKQVAVSDIGGVEFNESHTTGLEGLKKRLLNSEYNNSFKTEVDNEKYTLSLHAADGEVIYSDISKNFLEGVLNTITINEYEDGCYIYMPNTSYKYQGILALNQKINAGLKVEKIEVYKDEMLLSTLKTSPLFKGNFYSKDLLALNKEGNFSFKLYLCRVDNSNNNLTLSLSLLDNNNYKFQPKGNYPQYVSGSVLNTNYQDKDFFLNTVDVNDAVRGLLVKSNDGNFYTWDGEDKQTFRQGTTAPIARKPKRKGFMYYRTDVNIPFYWDGTYLRTVEGVKMDMNNFSIPKKSGNYAEKPESWREIPVGYSYFCTDKKAQEDGSDGIMIFYKGGDTWVDALGREIL